MLLNLKCQYFACYWGHAIAPLSSLYLFTQKSWYGVISALHLQNSIQVCWDLEGNEIWYFIMSHDLKLEM